LRGLQKSIEGWSCKFSPARSDERGFNPRGEQAERYADYEERQN
jgi:hypothetical protein